jgi:hypothetical protein
MCPSPISQQRLEGRHSSFQDKDSENIYFVVGFFGTVKFLFNETESRFSLDDRYTELN